MDIVFNHNLILSALRNGEHRRLKFGCQEKVHNVTSVPNTGDMIPRSHFDFILSDGTTLKAVPSSSFRFEASIATTSNKVTITKSSK